MRNNREYEICKALSNYIRLKYPKVIFHWDLAGLNLSRAQAGMTKAIQGNRGWPDLFIAQATGFCDNKPRVNGLFIEVKKEGTRLTKRNGEHATEHIREQHQCLLDLSKKGYVAFFGVGLDNCIEIIDNYLK